MTDVANPERCAEDPGLPVTRGPDNLTTRLGSVQDVVTQMEGALESGDLAAGTSWANELVVMTSEVLEGLGRDPSRHPDTDAELIATLRVYRNAAFAFRKLAGATGEPDPAMGTVCAAMIEQGHDLLRALVTKSVEQDAPDKPRDGRPGRA